MVVFLSNCVSSWCSNSWWLPFAWAPSNTFFCWGVNELTTEFLLNREVKTLVWESSTNLRPLFRSLDRQELPTPLLICLFAGAEYRVRLANLRGAWSLLGICVCCRHKSWHGRLHFFTCFFCLRSKTARLPQTTVHGGHDFAFISSMCCENKQV